MPSFNKVGFVRNCVLIIQEFLEKGSKVAHLKVVQVHPKGCGSPRVPCFSMEFPPVLVSWLYSSQMRVALLSRCDTGRK